MKKKLWLMLVAGLWACFAAAGAANAADKIQIVIFGPPSLGAMLPPIIKSEKFDAKHGLDLEFAERPPSAYTAQFNSGEFKVGGSAALLTVGLGDIRGVKIAYLFNYMDYYGAVVTSRPDIKALKDLEGKEIAGARATTNFKMFEFFASRQGADPSKFNVVNTAPPGLIGYAMADRADAIQIWEPALTSLRARKPSIRVLDLNIAAEWSKFAGSTNLPYLGVAAHIDWINQNKPLVPKLYAAYADAADWLVQNPDAAAKLILPKGAPDSQKAIADLIGEKDRLGLNLKWASDIEKEIKQVYVAGKTIGYLPKDPSPASIYSAK
jgi:NitT/TauT family transport system substrate-binding protein